jgi:hypothetical protein
MKKVADGTMNYIQCKNKENTASLRVNTIELIHSLSLYKTESSILGNF